MNKELTNLVFDLSLKNKKANLAYYRDEIFNNGREMAALTFDRNIGLYALSLQRYLDLIVNGKEHDKDYANYLLDTMMALKDYNGVEDYLKLRAKNAFLKNEINNYFKEVNVDFRNKLTLLETPPIYVLGVDSYTHIINQNDIVEDINIGDTLVTPVYNMSSKRDSRHFYNKLSFHYLESLIDDCDYNIENKKLGKIKILKK